MKVRALACGGLIAITGSAAAAQLTEGNLVVVQVGFGGANPLTSAAQSVGLVEYTSGGVVASTTYLPNAAGGTNFTLSGTSSSEGFLKRSVDRRFLTLAGYDAIVGTASVSTSMVSRLVARIDGNLDIDLSTVLTDGSYASSNVRSAISTNGTDLWLSGTAGIGANGGVRYTTVGSGAAAQLALSPTNMRVVNIFDGQLLSSSGASGFVGVSTIGSGLPATPGQTTTLLTVGLNTSSSPYDFYMPSPTTMYVACDTASAASGGGLQKWAFSAGAWALQYTLTSDFDPGASVNTGLRGLTGVVDAGSGLVTLYATTALSSGNQLVAVTDTGNAAPFAIVATAPMNTIFRGVAFAPVPMPICGAMGVPPPAPSADDWFGGSVAVSGDRMIVGAERQAVGVNQDQGSAHVYRRVGGEWTYEATLAPVERAPSDYFGCSVAIDGDYAVVGALGSNAGAATERGAAYVFFRSPNGWIQVAKLTPVGNNANDRFGSSVAISGVTVVVGAPHDDAGIASAEQGSAYVFVSNLNGLWPLQARLTDSFGESGDHFGAAVSVDVDAALIGAPRNSISAGDHKGYAVVFGRAGGVWTRHESLYGTLAQPNDENGAAVCVRGVYAVVGAPGDDTAFGVDAGSASIFRLVAGAWTADAQVLPTDGAAGDRFGSAVSVSNSVVVCGSPGDDVGGNTDQGSATALLFSGTSWKPLGWLTAPGGAAGDEFGLAVASSADDLVCGARLDDVGFNTNQGSAWAFRASSLVSIVTQPASGTICSVGTSTVSVQASATVSLTYDWQVESPQASGSYVSLPAGSFTEPASGLGFNLTGQGTPTLGFSGIALGTHASTIRFRVVVSHACTSLPSLPAEFLVRASVAISQQPQSVQACPTAGGTLTVAATGEAPISYQWRVQSPHGTLISVPLTGTSFTEASTGLSFTHLGATTNALSISGVTLGTHPSTIRFRCYVTNPCGTMLTALAGITICAADADCSGVITSADVAVFISRWFASLQNGTLDGDFDGNGAVTSADVGAFVSAWFAALSSGC